MNATHSPVIDLNCDLGEGCAYDAELMPLITSASVACGFHAGDATTALATLCAAATHGVRVGRIRASTTANIWPSRTRRQRRADFRRVRLSNRRAWRAWYCAAGVELHHVKPHGGLYNRACREDAYARPVVAAAELFGLPLFGLPGSRLEALSRRPLRLHRRGLRGSALSAGWFTRATLTDGCVRGRSAGSGAASRGVDAHAADSHALRSRRQSAGAGVRAPVREALTRQGIAIRHFQGV